ncbi:MAG: hypothetical protein AAGA54_28570 [Myxococcota bacterium]
MRQHVAVGIGWLVLMGCADDVVSLDTDSTSSSSSSSTDGGSLPSGPDAESSSTSSVDASTTGELECVDDLGCEALTGPCTRASCVDGVCESAPLEAGATPLTACDGSFCDGDGACVDCIQDRDCAPVDECELATCEAGVCQTTKDPSDACAAFEGILGFTTSEGMVRLDPSSGFLLQGGQEQLHARTLFGSGVRHVAVDPATGELVVNTLSRMDPNEGPAILFGLDPFDLEARAFHPDTGALWVMSQSVLQERDPGTGQILSLVQPLTPGPKGPEPANLEAMAFDDAGVLYALFAGNVQTVDLASGDLSLTADLPNDARGLVFDPAADVLYSATGSDALYVVDPDDGSVTTVDIPDMPELRTLAFDPVADVFYGFSGADFFGNSYVMHTIDPADGSWAFARRTGVPDVRGMAYDAATERMLVCSSVGLVSVDRQAQTFDLIAPADPPLSAIAFDDAGALFGITRSAPMLLSIDPTDGSSTEVAALSSVNYVDLTFDPGSGLLFASYATNAAPLEYQLATIDPQTGAETPLGPSNVTGGLAYVAASERLHGLDDAFNLVAIDPASGSGMGAIVGRSGYVGYQVPMDAVDGVLTAGGTVTFDVSTGQASFEGMPRWIDAVAFDPPTGDVLLTSSLLGVETTFRFDPATNVATTYSSVSPDTFAGDFAIAEDGTGYISRFSEFSRYDPLTGETTLLGPIFGLGPFAFDDEGVLFGTSGEALVTIDLRTASVTNVGEIGLALEELQWDPVNDRLVGITGNGVDPYGTYVEIDRSTGTPTVLMAGVPYSGNSIQLVAPPN